MLDWLGDKLRSESPAMEGRVARIRPARATDWREWSELRAISRGFLTPWEPTWPDDALTRSSFVRRVRRQTDDWERDQAYTFLVFDRENGNLTGGLGLTNVRRGVAQTATLGYWVGEPFARRGYISDATRLVLRFAFGELNLHRVEASCLPENAASTGLLEKVGFTREGHARAYLRIQGVWRDHLLFSFTNDEWREER